MDRNILPQETECLKQILIEAYQRGEISVNITASEMVEQLAQQLKQVFSK
jgi:predicted HTH domain antitoxin